MVLPTTTRGSTVHVLSPDIPACVAIIEVASTPESADHSIKAYDKKGAALGMDKDEGFQSMRETFVENQIHVHMMYEIAENYWGGKEPETDYINYQISSEALASKAVLAKNAGPINLDYAISDSSRLIRRYYTVEDNQSLSLPEDSKASCDTLLSTYLAKNGFLIEEVKGTNETFIYENDGKGHKRMEGSNPVKADPVEVRELISHPDKGFQLYLEKQQVNATVNLPPYPEVPVPARPEQEAPKATAERPETPGPSTEPGSTPQTPSV